MPTSTFSSHVARTNETTFRAMFEQSALGIATVRFADARWIDVNDALCRMLGRSREELLSSSWPVIPHPDDVAPARVLFARMAAGELDSYAVEKRFLHADGSHVWARLTLSLVRDTDGNPDYQLAIVDDIRERKAAEQALVASRTELEAERARLQTIVDTIPTGLIMLDEVGAMVLENAEWKRTWAGNALLNSVVDYDSYKGFRPDTGERIAAEEWPCAISLKQGLKTRDVILDIERFNGTRGTIVVSSAPIRDETGRVIAAVAANMDISELRAAQAQLQESDRRKDEFLAMLSHELRNPLAPIRNALFLLDQPGASHDQMRFAREVIGRQVGQLTRLVDDLLDVNRIAKGKIALQRATLDLGQLLQKTADDYRNVIGGQDRDFTVSVCDEPLRVDGDETRLVQVLGNLLGNAAKFTPPGGHIALAAVRAGAHVNIHVRDNGAGIAPVLLPHVFEPFTQADQSLARTEGGLGLGLALVKSIIELHGGSVAIESTPGEGTCVTVVLPLADGTAVGETATGAATCGAGVASRRILVVDDNPDAADSLAMLARMFDHEADVVYDGAAAVARARQIRYDLILCDLGLPGMSGYQVARCLKETMSAPPRMVAISGYAQGEDVQRSLAAGFDAHLAKPLDIQTVQALFDPGQSRQA
ncbi:PAS domain S-box protein [Massilia sp. IC2-278]|uniref:PAS domain-containing hybrid sensor histidine kinase/response regulator n=1 Tax=Massilia sp. IC2-278 TaxID=2887200 RepID=UPI001E2B6F27|nr:hybrid sensor histidine kinase/response regulator [Massilia sp. IC2-278]MCC2959586.1 PAS domain S-box protein [Massilia sp. IC2-278]